MNLVDSDVLIDVWRGHPPAKAWLAACTAIPSVPGFVVMELVQDVKNGQELRQALRLAEYFPTVWPSEADLTAALANSTRFRLSHGLGLIDSLIAATAVGRGATLLTFNTKHYRFIPDLAIAQPYQR